MMSAIRPSNRQSWPTKRLARDRMREGEDGGFDPEHPFAPEGGRRQVGELDVEDVLNVPPAARRPQAVQREARPARQLADGSEKN
jgi:hypothetical protein